MTAICPICRGTMRWINERFVCPVCGYDDTPELKPITNADRIRAMKDEELANFIVHRDCCPGFFTGIFSDSNRKKYGFDGRSERCEFGGDECIACWLDWLKQKEGEA